MNIEKLDDDNLHEIAEVLSSEIKRRYEEVFKKILDIAPTLPEMVLNLVPGKEDEIVAKLSSIISFETIEKKENIALLGNQISDLIRIGKIKKVGDFLVKS